MNDELEKLRPEVREAVVAIDGGNGVFVNSDDGIGSAKWKVVRAELLRLAGECATLSKLLDSARMDRIDEFRHANKVEAELAALKARIAGSDAGIVTQTFSHLGSDGADTTTVEAYPPKVFHHTAIGQRVRLVMEK